MFEVSAGCHSVVLDSGELLLESNSGKLCTFAQNTRLFARSGFSPTSLFDFEPHKPGRPLP